VIEINPETLVHSQHMPAIIQLFAQTLTHLKVRGLSESCTSFVLQIVTCVNKKLSDESKMAVITYYDVLIPALIAAVPND